MQIFRSKLPDDMQESVLQTLSIQALGQVTFFETMLRSLKQCFLNNNLACVLLCYSHRISLQGTEIQLGLAVNSKKATLSVKRRLACEQVIYFSQVFLIF